MSNKEGTTVSWSLSKFVSFVKQGLTVQVLCSMSDLKCKMHGNIFFLLRANFIFSWTLIFALVANFKQNCFHYIFPKCFMTCQSLKNFWKKDWVDSHVQQTPNPEAHDPELVPPRVKSVCLFLRLTIRLLQSTHSKTAWH